MPDKFYRLRIDIIDFKYVTNCYHILVMAEHIIACSPKIPGMHLFITFL